MAATYTQTKTIDEIYTRHAENYVGDPNYRDNAYRPRPLLYALREKARKASGGQNLKHRINFGTSNNGGALNRNQRFTIQGNVAETASTWTWSVLYQTCFVSWWDIMETENSPDSVLGVLDDRLKETDENLLDLILNQITQSSKASSQDLNTVLEIVNSTGAIGGLNPATTGQENWASQIEDTITWSVEGIGRTRQLKSAIEEAKGSPDIIVLPTAFKDESCVIGDAMQVSNIDAKTKGGTLYSNLGSTVVTILQMPVVTDYRWSTNQTATGVVLDLSAIHLIENRKWSMYMYPFKEMVYDGVLGQASVKLYVAQLTCSARRASGRLGTIS